MKEALGLIEIYGLSAAVVVADAMVKTASVTLHEIENTKGNGYMTIKIFGDVGAVNAAVMAGKQLALENNKFISAKVIPRPSIGVEKLFCTSPKKGKKIPVPAEVKGMPVSKEEERIPVQQENEKIPVPEEEEEIHVPEENQKIPASEEKEEETATDTKPQLQDSKEINTSSKSSKTSKHKTERNKPE
ncbi:MAG: BMC domain-containing protein [Lachnospiraceae bacterium]|nr:BMC domain-containing protein [Lachnospiraceae bacterium]